MFADVEMRGGVHYMEVQLRHGGVNIMVGVARPGLAVNTNHYSTANAWNICLNSGGLYGNGMSNSNAAGAFVVGDRIGVLVDLSNGSVLFFKNGVQHGPGYLPGTVTGPLVFAAEVHSGGAKLLPDAALPAGFDG